MIALPTDVVMLMQQVYDTTYDTSTRLTAAVLIIAWYREQDWQREQTQQEQDAKARRKTESVT